MATATAFAYRDADILTASPVRLVVMTFDATLGALTRARAAFTMQNHEVAHASLDKSRLLLGELLVALDRERGGDIAVRLTALYTFVLTELSDLGVRQDLQRLDRIISMLRQLRDAFAEIATARPAAVA